MLIPVIKIKETSGADETAHIIGTDSHDKLYIKNNAIHYINLQNSETSERCLGYESTYKFIGERNEYMFPAEDEMEIEMWDIDQLIEFAIKHACETAERKAKLAELLKMYDDAIEKCEKTIENTGMTIFDGSVL